MLQIPLGIDIPTEDEMQSFCNIISHAPYISVDTESDHKMDIFLGISCSHTATGGMYFPVGHPFEPEVNVSDETLAVILATIANSPLRVLQNAGYDLLRMEEKLGCKLPGPFVDTMQVAHMVDENVKSKGLDYLHKHYTGGEGKNRHPYMQQIIDDLGWAYVPVRLMAEYGTNDAVITAELFEVLEPLYVEQFGPFYS